MEFLLIESSRRMGTEWRFGATMKTDFWVCIVSERAARIILQAFLACQVRNDLAEVGEVLRSIRVQHPHFEAEFACLPWPGRTSAL